MLQKNVIEVVIAILTLSICSARLIVNVTLGTFYSPSSVKCDLFSKCDFKFHFCIDSLRSSSCRYVNQKTGVLGNAPISFDTTFHSPMFTIPMDNWEGGITLRVNVVDYDAGSRDDDIDTLKADYTGPIGSSKFVNMKRRTTLPVLFSSSCSPNYYGSLCSVFCKPSYHHQHGYYNCHTQHGSKICLPEWTGSMCNVKLTTIFEEPITEATTAIRGTDTTINITELQTTQFPDDITTDVVYDTREFRENVTQWTCRQTTVATKEENETIAESLFSSVLTDVLNTLSEYDSNVTLNFQFNWSDSCYGTGAYTLFFEYCLQTELDEEINIEHLFQHPDDQTNEIMSTHNLITVGCDFPSIKHAMNESSNSGLLWEIVASLLAFVMIAAVIILIARFVARRKKSGASRDNEMSHAVPIYINDDHDGHFAGLDLQPAENEQFHSQNRYTFN